MSWVNGRKLKRFFSFFSLFLFSYYPLDLSKKRKTESIVTFSSLLFLYNSMIFRFYRLGPSSVANCYGLWEKTIHSSSGLTSHIVCIPKIFLVDEEIDVCGDHDILFLRGAFHLCWGTRPLVIAQWKPNMRWDDGSPKLFLPLAFLPAPSRKTGDELKSNNCSKKIHRLRLGDRHRLTHRATYTQSILWGIYPPFFYYSFRWSLSDVH